MAKKKTDGDAAPKGKAKKIVGAAVLIVLGALVGGKVMGGGSQAAATGTTTTTTKPPGPVIPIDPITVNLADGHVLKVGLALELESEKAAALTPTTTSKDADPTKGFASGLDAAVSVFGAKTYDALLPQAGRDAARAELRQKLDERYPGAIANIYLYEFVMQ